MSKAQHIQIGDIYGRLKVVQCINTDAHNTDAQRTWHCVCTCGNTKDVQGNLLLRGVTCSCGCLRRENLVKMRTTHGLTGTRVYGVWRDIKQRCYNPNNPSYPIYGQKGIKLCEEWQDPQAFVDWSYNHGYQDGLTIDRIDSNGNYCPKNCRWVDRKTQNNNTSRNHLLTWNGVTKTMAQWADELDLSYSCIKTRINKRGWSVEKALSTPNLNPRK